MTAITIEALGLSKDELADRLVEKAVEELLSDQTYDEDGEPYGRKNSQFKAALHKRIENQIDRAIDEIAAKNVLPNVASYVEGLCLQATNQWGEKKGASVTFIEYLVQRAEAYLTEKVDYNGQRKGEPNSYNWSGTQTRITFMVHKHLQYSIEQAMKEAMANATKSVAAGIHETVRIKLDEVAAKLKVEVRS